MRGAARFTSGISNYACRKLGFGEDNAEIALYAKLHVVGNAASLVAQDRSVGVEALSFNGMELGGGGLEHQYTSGCKRGTSYLSGVSSSTLGFASAS